jgi:hypothetical protein
MGRCIVSYGEEANYLGESCTWRGASGQRYRFSVYDVDTPTLSLDGVFILAAPGDLFVPFRPIFIGEAADFADHLPKSVERRRAVELGATTLHLYYSNRTHPDRFRVFGDLMARYGADLALAEQTFGPVKQPAPAQPSAQIIQFRPRPRGLALSA